LLTLKKQWTDLAGQHAIDSVEILKKAAEKLPGMPVFFLLEATNGFVKAYVETQKAPIIS
jgi:hypothetical protein